MATRIESIAEICGTVAQLVREKHRNLTLHFVQTTGDRQAAARRQAIVDLAAHPAEATIRRLLEAENEGAAPLAGVVVARQNVFFGLATHDQLLALALLDIGAYADPKEARSQSYHLAWHALDAYDRHNDPVHHSSLTDHVRLPQRSVASVALANLEADIFAVTIGGLLGENSGVRRLAMMRARAVLLPQAGVAGLVFPMPVALEAAEFSIRLARQSTPLRRHYLDAARRESRRAAKLIADEVDIWLRFAAAAQAMAWRGAAPDQILGAAITTSDDVDLRKLGHLVSDLTGIDPAPMQEITHLYSAFASPETNARLHMKAIAAIWRNVLAQALRTDSRQPFLNEAAHQNNGLREAQTFGWCAPALQAAARVAAAHGGQRDLAAAATREFESECRRWPWPTLHMLGEDIAERRRGGATVTPADIERLTHQAQQRAFYEDQTPENKPLLPSMHDMSRFLEIGEPA